MTSPVIKDQVQQGKDRLVTQWNDKEVVQGLLKSYMENVQTVEDIYQQLLDERSVFTAIGEQLNVVGLLVGEARGGKDDSAYREAILNRVAINTSDGTPEKIIEVMKTIIGSDSVTLFEHYPANIHVHTTSGATNVNAASLNNITPAGVSGRLMFDDGIVTWIGAAVTSAEANLVTESLDNIEVEEGSGPFELVTSNRDIIPFGNTASFPHLLETGTINPLCAVLSTKLLITTIGILEDDSNNLFTDESGNFIEYQIIEEII
jgi:hypothetical protein